MYNIFGVNEPRLVGPGETLPFAPLPSDKRTAIARFIETMFNKDRTNFFFNDASLLGRSVFPVLADKAKPLPQGDFRLLVGRAVTTASYTLKDAPLNAKSSAKGYLVVKVRQDHPPSNVIGSIA